MLLRCSELLLGGGWGRGRRRGCGGFDGIRQFEGLRGGWVAYWYANLRRGKGPADKDATTATSPPGLEVVERSGSEL